MRILQIHRYFYIEGGTERYFFELSKLLKKKGHQIAYFSMHDRKNYKTKWNKYFVSNVSIEDKSLIGRLRLAGRMIYSYEARKKIRQLLNDFRPGIVHIHNLNLFISPSILSVIRNRGIPIVQTVHDYHLLAPTRGSLFHNGSICEITKPDKYYKAIFHKCIGSSYVATLLFVITQYIHKILKMYDHVDLFIAPSKFMRKKMIEYGIKDNKIMFLPNFANPRIDKVYRSKDFGSYILYFGRLSPEKGVDKLIKIVRMLPKIKLKIAGRGSINYEKYLKHQTSNCNNIEFVGFREGNDLQNLIYNSKFTVLPSQWWENYPNSLLESFFWGKPVVASDIGGIPEIIKNYKNGYLFLPSSISDFKNKINFLWNHDIVVKNMGFNAKKIYRTKYNYFFHYKKLINTYQMLVVNKKEY